jgi:type IV pilus assembly protein PilN
VSAPISINLASEPFRPVRSMLAVAGLAALLLTGLLGFLIALSVSEKGQAAQTRQTIAGLQGRLKTLSGQQAQLESVLRKPENAEVLDRSLFLNSLLYAKGISWTRLFDDLEKVLPYNVRLIQVRPQVNSLNQISLEMVVGADSSEPVIRMLTLLERSPQFGETLIHNRMPPTQSDPLLRFRISVNYAQKL